MHGNVYRGDWPSAAEAADDVSDQVAEIPEL